MIKGINSAKAPAATGPFSQAIDTGNFVFTGGQIYLTPDGILLDGKIEDQVKQVMENLKAVLESANLSFANVVKSTIYVTDMSIYGKVNEIYGKYFSNPYPAREVIGVKELPLGAKLEISMIAAKP